MIVKLYLIIIIFHILIVFYKKGKFYCPTKNSRCVIHCNSDIDCPTAKPVCGPFLKNSNNKICSVSNDILTKQTGGNNPKYNIYSLSNNTDINNKAYFKDIFNTKPNILDNVSAESSSSTLTGWNQESTINNIPNENTIFMNDNNIIINPVYYYLAGINEVKVADLRYTTKYLDSQVLYQTITPSSFNLSDMVVQAENIIYNDIDNIYDGFLISNDENDNAIIKLYKLPYDLIILYSAKKFNNNSGYGKFKKYNIKQKNIIFTILQNKSTTSTATTPTINLANRPFRLNFENDKFMQNHLYMNFNSISDKEDIDNFMIGEI